MIKKVMLILIIGFTSLILCADDSNTQRNSITRSAAFWKLYTDALRGEKAAQFETGVMFERGMGVELNQTQAAKWYEKAAIQGHRDAQYNIGIMYATGRGVEQNDQFAMMWLASAAKQGDNESRTLLLEIIDGKSKSNNKSNSLDTESLQNIKPIRFETKEGASICRSSSASQCHILNEKQIYTSRSKQGSYYKISGIATGHGWEAYKGDGWIDTSMIEVK
jgi:TPR repeat protein